MTAMGDKRYTAFVEWELEGIEEIDVDAANERDARAKAQAILDRDYIPNGDIVQIMERFGWYA